MFEQEIKTFQTRLKALRIKRGWTQKYLSALTNIDHGYISKLENGKKQNPSYKILLRLCHGLKCSLYELTGK